MRRFGAVSTASSASPTTTARSPREERAHRILDAAADLILRWGYDKTTIDDIARTAGVAKGTIYLHWKSRETLFVALLRRERLAMLEATRHRVGQSGDDATLGGLLTHLVRELHRHPVMKAVFVRDTEVLGRLARQKQTAEGTDVLRSGFADYLDALRGCGAVRFDLSTAEAANVIGAMVYGTLLVAPLMTDAYALSAEQRAALVGETVQRTFTTGEPLSARDREVAARATRDYLDLAIAVTRDKVAQSLSTRPADHTPLATDNERTQQPQAKDGTP
jgi:AcrR family transcriptional regulator